MYILEDTRQKSGAHTQLHKGLKEDGVVLYRSKLPFADYCLVPEVGIDTKADLLEIANNLCGSQNEQGRVKNEEKLAARLGSKIIFLIEQEGVENMADLIGMKIVLRSGKEVSGEQLKRAMENHEHIYGSKFLFCKPSETAKKLEEILRKEHIMTQ